MVNMWRDTTMACSIRHLLPLLTLLLNIERIKSLKLSELRVPTYVPLGQRAQLSCRWQLGPHDALYSVKWYKDGKEFFRHVPRDFEPRRKFPLPGVDVEDFDLTGSKLTLSPAVPETGGRYRCEVSGERPLFHTVSDHGDLMVVVLPEHGPEISGLHPRYRIGDRVRVNCTSGLSRPATNLSWYINGEPASAHTVLPPINETNSSGPLERTTLMLDFVVKESQFNRSRLKVKCLATLAPLYWRSNEETAIRETSLHKELLKTSPDTETSHKYKDFRVTRADRVMASQGTLRATSSHVFILLVFKLFLEI